MSWIKLDNDFTHHPKILELSLEARWLYLAGLCYASRYLTDGFLSNKAADFLGYSQCIPELLKIGLWNVMDDGYSIDQYCDYQSTKSEVEEIKAQNRERQKKYQEMRKSKGVVDTNAVNNALITEPPNDVNNALITAIDIDTDIDIDIDADIDTDIKINKNKISNLSDKSFDAPFEEFWKIYPRKQAKKEAKDKFIKALKSEPAILDEIMAGVERYAKDPNREDAFTTLAATWLNQERWNDDPLPERYIKTAKSRSRDIMQAWIQEEESK